MLPEQGPRARATQVRSPQFNTASTSRNRRASACSPGAAAALRHAGRDIEDAVLAHIWPTHHENVHFYGTHSVDVDGEFAKLDADGYRPLRTGTATEAS